MTLADADSPLAPVTPSRMSSRLNYSNDIVTQNLP